MVIKEQVREYLTNIVEELEKIDKEELRVVASLGVVHVLQEFLHELLVTKNIYKGDL